MRSNRAHLVLGALFVTAVVSGRAAAESGPACEPACDDGQTCVNGACAPAAPGGAAPAKPTPKVAAATAGRAAGPAPLWNEGFQILPAVGIHSLQGDAGQGRGVGLRLGLMAGARLVENFSLNLGLAYDRANFSNAPGVSAFTFEVSANPLIHFPQEKFEILAGPALGTYLDKGSAGSVSDTWGYGWSIGVNAGAMMRVGSRAKVGALLTFLLRNTRKTCTTTNGIDVCATSGIPTGKVLGLALAAMF
jgi:hypothetical protein